MKIDRLILPPLDNNCYIISNNGEAIIVDPASSENVIEEFLKKNNLQLVAIFITHYHFDHIGALGFFVNKYKVPVYDYKTIGKIKIANLKLEVVPTKGHDKTCVSFYFKETADLFVGDFLFEGSIGRMDLEGGDEEEMAYSLRWVKTLPKETKIYTGHDNTTTLEKELLNNPYL